VLSPTQELLARSDDNRPPEPDTLATIQYRAEVGGLFTIAATRAGNKDGTTTGAYQLRILKVNEIPDRENELAPVEFRCDAMVATNALMITFQDEIPATVPAGGYRERYRITTYGQSDFAPLILADSDLVKTGRLDCSRDASAVLGNTYTLPGASAVTITEAEQTHSAQMTLQNTSLTEQFGEVRFQVLHGFLELAGRLYFGIDVGRIPGMDGCPPRLIFFHGLGDQALQDRHVLAFGTQKPGFVARVGVLHFYVPQTP
jgi:hypothetical protein